MANWHEPDEEERAKWQAWVDARPPLVKDLAERFPPWKLYRLLSSGHRVHVYSYAESGTMTVVVRKEFNLLAFERQVFGVPPEDLVECDLPGKDAPVGVVLEEPADVEKYVAKVAEQMKQKQTTESN